MLKIIIAKDKVTPEEDAARRVAGMMKREVQMPIIPAVNSAHMQMNCFFCGELGWYPVGTRNPFCSDRCKKEDQKRVGFQ